MKTLFSIVLLLISFHMNAQQQQPKVDLRLDQYNKAVQYGAGLIVTGIFITGGAYIAMEGDRGARDVMHSLMAGGAAIAFTGTYITLRAYRKGTQQKQLYLAPGEVSYRF